MAETSLASSALSSDLTSPKASCDERGVSSKARRSQRRRTYDGGGLAADNGTETGLALDDDVGDAHLAAEGGEEDDELNGVNVVGDDDEVGLLLLDETDDVL
jgi:hypothetical protein